MKGQAAAAAPAPTSLVPLQAAYGAPFHPADLRPHAGNFVRGSKTKQNTGGRPETTSIRARSTTSTDLRAVARGGDGRRRRWRGRRKPAHLAPAAEDAGELRRELLHAGGLGRGVRDGLGVDDANVGEDLPGQPATVEVVGLGREAVRHGRGRARDEPTRGKGEGKRSEAG